MIRKLLLLWIQKKDPIPIMQKQLTIKNYLGLWTFCSVLPFIVVSLFHSTNHIVQYNGHLIDNISFCTSIREWEFGVFLRKNKLPAMRVSLFALSPEDTRIATTSKEKTLQLWEAATHNHLFTYPGYAGRITFITWAPDGKRLAIVLADSTIHILQT